MNPTRSTGVIGAMLDEYDRASADLYRFGERLPEADYLRIDRGVTDEDCRSVQTIMSHAGSAGYGYAYYIRQVLGMEIELPGRPLLSQSEALAGLRVILALLYEEPILRRTFGRATWSTAGGRGDGGRTSGTDSRRL